MRSMVVVVVALPAGRSMAEQIYYLYILRSRNDLKFYTGITTDINKRLREHNRRSKATRSTVSRRDFEIIYVEECQTREEARDREKFWKSGQGREYRD
jgi:putative endonuclease